MKKVLISIVAIFFCVVAFSSAAKATTINVTPYFSFAYGDPNSAGHTYQIFYAIENSDPLMGNWNYIGSSATYPPNVMWNTYQAPSSITVTEPAGPPIPVKCYRIVMKIVRDDGRRLTLTSVWATAADLQNNSLYLSGSF